MTDRRKFLTHSFLGSLAVLLDKKGIAEVMDDSMTARSSPVVISTWEPNVKANAAAWKILSKGGRALDAVVTGVQVPEADPKDNSVGYGGLPDRDGRVTLDSCVMDEFGNCGAVMAIEYIMHPVLVARFVMEKTPHVQLVGEGALQFALSQGFSKQNLLTPDAEAAWKEWLKTANYDPNTTSREYEKNMKNENPGHEEAPWPAAILNHDTIGMIAVDVKGNLGGACTTSGMAYKMRGRVGDSPIIGAGLFVDNEIGGASATGVGEEVIKVCGSHTVVESMRRGLTPTAACKEAVRRIIKKSGNKFQVGFIALNKNGQYGGFSIQPGFTYGVTTKMGTKVITSASWYK